MSRAFEYFVLQSSTYRDGKVVNMSYFPEPHPDMKPALDPILEQYDLDTDWLFWRFRDSLGRDRAFPWAIILFDREYRLACHIAALRKDPRDFAFSAYSLTQDHSIEKHGPPPVSILFFWKKHTLRCYGHRSPLLQPAWKALRKSSSSRNWVCLSDAPDENWLRRHEDGDKRLFYDVMREGVGQRTTTQYKCPKCGKTMLCRNGRFGLFLMCSDHLECKTTMKIDSRGNVVSPKPLPEPTGIKCFKCKEGELVIRRTKRSRFMGCSRFPKCATIVSIRHLDFLQRLQGEGRWPPATPEEGKDLLQQNE